ncbi:MAG: Ig-like domain-containing protein, partial [Clostridia bacterium]|nr:Ig-like domain-containing protein [Clostridia bacterium]
MQPLAAPLSHNLTFTQSITALTVTPANPILYLTDEKATPLTVTHSPETMEKPTLRFSSNDTDIVKVSADGALTPVSAGTAT